MFLPWVPVVFYPGVLLGLEHQCATFAPWVNRVTKGIRPYENTNAWRSCERSFAIQVNSIKGYKIRKNKRERSGPNFNTSGIGVNADLAREIGRLEAELKAERRLTEQLGEQVTDLKEQRDQWLGQAKTLALVNQNKAEGQEKKQPSRTINDLDKII